MSIFSGFSIFFVLALIFIDSVFLPRPANHARKWMIGFYLSILGFIGLTDFFQIVAAYVGVGRPVDMLIYISVIVLLRELFLSRIRYYQTLNQLTGLAREFALLNVKKNKG